MKLLAAHRLNGTDLAKLCVRTWTREASLTERVSGICRDVKQRGDAALRDYSTRFDAAAIERFRVTEVEIERAPARVPASLLGAIERAAANIRSFHAAQRKQEPVVETESGVRCWRVMRAIDTVGLYIPAGSAPLPSTVLMLGIPAQLAGCKRIILCSPPTATGSVNDGVLAAASLIGLREIYSVGGAQAIAAMAYGTASVPKVDKIFGPGSQYVTEAKRIVSSEPDGAAIDLLAGPSELLVLADETADARVIAADLLSQAEHDPNSQVVLVTTSDELARDVLAQATARLQKLPRKEIILQALDNSYALVVRSLEEAVAFSNQYAPEHLIINTANPEAVANDIRHAGSVFLGKYSPITAGDYASGTNHTLPTGATARWTSGVTVESFQKSVTFQTLTESGLDNLAPTLMMLAEAEGLQAHAEAVRIRQTGISAT